MAEVARVVGGCTPRQLVAQADARADAAPAADADADADAMAVDANANAAPAADADAEAARAAKGTRTRRRHRHHLQHAPDRSGRRQRAGVQATLILLGNAKFAVSAKGSEASAVRAVRALVESYPPFAVRPVGEFGTSKVRPP
jgi:hypothetical protein